VLGDLVVTGFDRADGREPGVAYENLQSRLRGLTLMALSNETGAIVLTTGNKSEYAVGLRHPLRRHGRRVRAAQGRPEAAGLRARPVAQPRRRGDPDLTIDKPPSAELRPDQLDEDSLPPYEVLDDIVDRLRREDLGIDDASSPAATTRPRSAAPGPAADRPRRVQAPPGRARARRSPRAPSAATAASRSPTAGAADAPAPSARLRIGNGTRSRAKSRFVPAASAKADAGPSVAASSAPSAGPAARATVKGIEFTATAAASSLGRTRAGISAFMAGPPTTNPMPTTSAVADDRPCPWQALDPDQRDPQRQAARTRRRDQPARDQLTAPVTAVRHGSAQGSEQQLRAELRHAHQPDHERRTRQLPGQDGRDDVVDPDPRRRQGLAGEERAEDRVGQQLPRGPWRRRGGQGRARAAEAFDHADPAAPSKPRSSRSSSACRAVSSSWSHAVDGHGQHRAAPCRHRGEQFRPGRTQVEAGTPSVVRTGAALQQTRLRRTLDQTAGGGGVDGQHLGDLTDGRRLGSALHRPQEPDRGEPDRRVEVTEQGAPVARPQQDTTQLHQELVEVVRPLVVGARDGAAGDGDGGSRGGGPMGGVVSM
jgi:hypothetical protein